MTNRHAHSTTARGRKAAAFGGALAVIAAAAAAIAQPVDVAIGNDREHPESVTSIADGTLIFAVRGKSAVYRAAPGAAATPWIVQGLDIVSGVFAYVGTLWVCSSSPQLGGPTYAYSYDVLSGARTGSYEFPGGGFCADFAVGRDGTVFVADSANARILALRPGTSTLTVFAENEVLAGISGLAVVDAKLYASNAATNAILLVDVTSDGRVGRISPIALSVPIDGPDGMRVLLDDTGVLVVESRGGRLLKITIDDGRGDVQVIRTGFDGVTGVTQFRTVAYVVEGKLDYLANPAMGNPGAFVAYAVPLP